jgi:D-amino peptidase
MRVFMSLDLEGATGVFATAQTEPTDSSYPAACALLAGDATAAVEGCLAAGADEIVVADGHHLGQNLSVTDLPAAVVLRSGFPGPDSWISGVGPGFDVGVFVAYHAMAGTLNGVLDHTYDSSRVYSVELEGFGEIGEFGLAAAVCGAYGFPVVFASGDVCLADEAKTTVPGIHTVAVKEGLGRCNARLLSPELTRQRIRDGVRAALTSEKPQPLSWDGRFMRITFTRSDFCDAAAVCPGVKRETARALITPQDDFRAVFSCFLACMELAASVDPL